MEWRFLVEKVPVIWIDCNGFAGLFEKCDGFKVDHEGKNKVYTGWSYKGDYWL